MSVLFFLCYHVPELLWEGLNSLHFDESKLLRAYAFSTGPIMIHAWLVVKRRENGETLSKFDLVPLLESVEMPANEGVIIRVGISGDKRATPINLSSKYNNFKCSEGSQPCSCD